jgi:hypothetical protein
MCRRCDHGFSLASGFAQHVDSPSCDEGLLFSRRSAVSLLRQLRHDMGLEMQMMFGIWI